MRLQKGEYERRLPIPTNIQLISSQVMLGVSHLTHLINPTWNYIPTLVRMIQMSALYCPTTH